MDQVKAVPLTINNTRGGPVIQNNQITGSIFINARDEREVENKCMSDLFHTDPKIYRAEIISRKGLRVEGTCEWITENPTYQSWLSSGSQLLWLSGGPGRGKTTLSIYLAEIFEECAEHLENTIILEYFCTSQDEKRSTTSSVIRGLIYQLLDQCPELFRHILRGYRRHGATLFTSFELVWKIFADMIHDPVLRAVYCILDGLDEIFDEPSLRILLRNISDIFSKRVTKRLSCSFKLIVVSREFPESLPEQLSKFPHIRVEPEADIHKFIDTRVDELAECRHYSKSLTSHVKKVFLKRAECTFLWVAVVAEELRKHALTEVEEALNRFASGLDGLYTQILQQIPENRRIAAARILSWVTLAVRPLTIAELSVVLETKSRADRGSYPEDVIKEYLRFCGNLLDVTGSTVRLVHQSAKEFLLQRNIYSNPHLETFRVDEIKGNSEIAMTCLSYLQEGALADGALDLRKDQRRLEAFPLLKYAALHWFEHTRLLSSSEDIFDLSLPFHQHKSPVRASWLQTYWAIGELKAEGEPYKSPEHFPLLHFACYFGIVPLAQKLLSRARWKKMLRIVDERVNEVDSCGQTPLIWAAMKGHLLVVKLLLREPNILAGYRGSRGDTPLHYAARGGHYTITALLLLRRDVVADCKNDTASTPLMGAALNGHEGIVKLLVERPDVDINSTDNMGNASLYLACWLGREPIIRLLLEKPEIKPDWKGAYGLTALYLASEEGHEAAVRLLLAQPDVAPNTQTQYGATPLFIAVYRGQEQVVRLLLERPDVDVNIKQHIGQTPLIAAAENGHVSILRCLLSRTDIEPNLAQNNGTTALIHASEQGHETIVELLLRRQDVEVNLVNMHDETALHKAALHGYESVVRLLLQRPDINIGIKSDGHCSALCEAARASDVYRKSGNGHEAIVRLLLERPEIDIDDEPEDYCFLYHAATRGRNEAIIQLLQSTRPSWGSWTYKHEDGLYKPGPWVPNA